MKTECVAVLLAFAVSGHALAQSHKPETLAERVAAAKNMCRAYVDNFADRKTDLVYSRRPAGPKGQAIFESPEAVAIGHVRGKYKPYGYGAGFEDVAYQNGTFLFALCEAYDATGDACFAELGHRIFQGMKRIGTLSPAPGFVPRGPHPDGKSYYRDSSHDQHTLYVAGLWRYYRSKIANDEEKAFIGDSLHKVAARMEKNKWILLVEDNSRRAHAGAGDWHHSDHLMLFILAAVKDVTGSAHWQAEYNKCSNEKDGDRWKRMARPLRKKLPRYTVFNNQNAFRLNVLSRVEQDPVRKEIPLARSRRLAADMFTCDFITHWRQVDYLGPKRGKADVAAYFKAFGYPAKSSFTIFELWDKHGCPGHGTVILPDGTKKYHISVTKNVPLMAWQIAYLSDDRDLASQVGARIPEVRKRTTFRGDHAGFGTNYAVILTLLDVAALAKDMKVKNSPEPKPR